MSNDALGAEYDISEGAVRHILKQESEIVKALQSGRNIDAKHVDHKLLFPQIDDFCFEILQAARKQQYPVRPKDIMNFGLWKAKELGIEDFRASQGWCAKFCKRHDADFRKLHGKYLIMITRSRFYYFSELLVTHVPSIIFQEKLLVRIQHWSICGC